MAGSVPVVYKLGISYQIGVDSKGKDIFNGQSFGNLRLTTTDEELVGFVDKIQVLLYDEYSISTIKKNLTYVVTRS